MNTGLIVQVLALLVPIHSFAEDLCEPRESIRQRVKYCHENLEYVEPAQACGNEYRNVVKVEQERLKAILATKLKEAPGSAQNQDFQTSNAVLVSALDDLTYLIDYGKQVHTEIEDYVYATVPPIFNDEDAKADINDPKVMERFRESECFGPPITEMEEVEASLRPVIEDLEKTREEVRSLIQDTSHSEANLGSLNSNSKSASKNGLVASKSGKHPKYSSTVTGKIEQKNLASTETQRTLKGNLARNAKAAAFLRTPANAARFQESIAPTAKTFLPAGQLDSIHSDTAPKISFLSGNSESVSASNPSNSYSPKENQAGKISGGLVGSLIGQARGLQNADANDGEIYDGAIYSTAVTGEADVVSGSASENAASPSLFERVHSFMRKQQRVGSGP